MNLLFVLNNHEEQMKFIKSSLPLLSACLLLAACSESKSNLKGPGASQNETVQADGSNINGNYAGEIWPVNYNLHFRSLGMVGVKREGDSFEAMVSMKYAPKGTTLRPAIYTARRCPTIKDDLNKDAYIDILEARLAIGKVTIPFDGDLDSQMGGRGSYSSSDVTGKFSYHRTASFDRMFADLKSPDEDSHDQLVKLGEEEGLTFPGRIVIIHGLEKEIKLPESVATTDGESAHESLPIACAVLWKVKDMPEELKQITTTP
jgi:hypothetical protein